jgi:hypothetical protein
MTRQIIWWTRTGSQSGRLTYEDAISCRQTAYTYTSVVIPVSQWRCSVRIYGRKARQFPRNAPRVSSSSLT